MADAHQIEVTAPRTSVRGPADDAFDRMVSDLLPLCDVVALLVAAQAVPVAYGALVSLGVMAAGSTGDLSPIGWIAAVIAPFLLYEPRFAALVRGGHLVDLWLGLVRRLAILFAVTGAVVYAGRWMDTVSGAWVALWFGCAALTTTTYRMLLVLRLRRRLARRARAAGSGTGPGAVESRAQPIQFVGEALPVVLLLDRPIRRWNAVLKAFMDFTVATLVGLVLLPALVLIALSIRLDSPGPILFRQRRHGLSNREFDIYKFRTMRYVADGADKSLRQTVRGDDRVTRVGRFLRKWSLDELPQLLNVLEGSMSLIGPRPHAVNMRTEALLGPDIVDTYSHRHRVRPGITGWSQINGARGATDTVQQLRRRVELDLYYIDHWSLLLDLKILTLTSREVMRATNAY